MQPRYQPTIGLGILPYLPLIGFVLALCLLIGLCVIPVLYVGLINAALAKLHLTPALAILSLLGILVGGLVNIPVYRFRPEQEPTIHRGWQLADQLNWVPMRHSRLETVVALNVGGCIVPTILAVYLASIVLSGPTDARLALALATLANIAVCYWLAKPIPGVGIALPALIPPLVAVGMAWLFLSGSQYDDVRAPVAFVAGVAGPLIGADLLHWKWFSQARSSVVSIGGAGTFDGIVLSGVLAAFIA
jgi:uncharacterized membrane protein